MSEETKKIEPTARPMQRSAPVAATAGPRTATLTFDRDDLASINAAMLVLKQARADIEAAERAKG